MNKEFLEALKALAEAKGISVDTLFNAVENALKKSLEKEHEGVENVHVHMDRETGDYEIFQTREVIEGKPSVKDRTILISLMDAQKIDPDVVIGQTVDVPVNSKDYARITAQNAKSQILQSIREAERAGSDKFFKEHLHEVLSMKVSHVDKEKISCDVEGLSVVIPKENWIPGESFRPNQYIKVYIESLKETNNGLRVNLSRNRSGMVRKLFEEEVPEIKDGIVEIKAITREAGVRVKMAVWSEKEEIDPVGACIGLNGSRINAIVDEINGEKVDIIKWDPNPAYFVENALAPAKVVAVAADEDENSAIVVVPDDQLSLAIGIKGLNARLAAKLTEYKIDIKSETQAREEGLFDDFGDTEEEGEGYEETSEEDNDQEGEEA